MKEQDATLGPRGIPEIENWRLETGLPIGLQETHLGQSPISASVKAREMRGLSVARSEVAKSANAWLGRADSNLRVAKSACDPLSSLDAKLGVVNVSAALVGIIRQTEACYHSREEPAWVMPCPPAGAVPPIRSPRCGPKGWPAACRGGLLFKEQLFVIRKFNQQRDAGAADCRSERPEASFRHRKRFRAIC